MSEPAGLISIVGGECTGKSTLAAALGIRLPAIVVSEFLREWVDQNAGRVPRPEEQSSVMAVHHESEVVALAQADRIGPPWVVSDSGPLMTAVYSIQYYDDASLLPLALEWTARSRQIVWCQDDFPWRRDAQRESSHARAESQQILAAIFAENPGLPVLAVDGTSDERAGAVVDAVARRGG